MVFSLCRRWELYFSNSLNLDWHWLYFLNAFKNFSESRVLSTASYLTVTSCIVTLQSMRELNPPSSHWQCDMLNLYTNRLYDHFYFYNSLSHLKKNVSKKKTKLYWVWDLNPWYLSWKNGDLTNLSNPTLKNNHSYFHKPEWFELNLN